MDRHHRWSIVYVTVTVTEKLFSSLHNKTRQTCPPESLLVKSQLAVQHVVTLAVQRAVQRAVQHVGQQPVAASLHPNASLPNFQKKFKRSKARRR